MDTSRNAELISRKRARRPLSQYSLSPERYSRREIDNPCHGPKLPAWSFSSASETSARPTARPGEAWITSSDRWARSSRALCSPKAQRIASTRLLLPLPLAPTNAAIPGPNSIRTCRAKLLKPLMSSVLRYRNLPPDEIETLYEHVLRRLESFY